jgi:murein L,D-transpeptidase YafK
MRSWFAAACLTFAAVALLTTPAPSRAAPAMAPAAERADFILVEKGARRLSLMREGGVIREYRVSLGSHPLGDKQEQGDGRTPEGRYTIDYRNAASAYYLSFHISYPDSTEVRRRAPAGSRPAATS